LVLPLYVRKPPSWSTLQGSFHPIKCWLFLTTLIGLFSWGMCFMMLIMSFPILLWSFKLIPYVLVGFWRLWLFDYRLSLTLVFTTLNLIDWYKTRGIPFISVSRTYVQYFSSIWWGNPKLLAFQWEFQIWSLMGVTVHGSIMNYRLSNQYLSDIWPTLPLHAWMLAPYSTHWASFAPFFLWRVREEFRRESTSTFCEDKRI
jgi:hypothetical protein